MPKIIYNTAADHEKLIRLYARHGYAITHRGKGRWCSSPNRSRNRGTPPVTPRA